MRSILEGGLDQQVDATVEPAPYPRVHENVRGASYYGGGEEKPC